MKLEISDKTAHRFNQAVEAYFKAQRRFNQKFGRAWDPVTDPIQIKWTAKQKAAWNRVAKAMNTLIERDGPFHPNDFTNDFLVRNTASAVAVASDNGARWISFAVGCGAAYVLLRGL